MQDHYLDFGGAGPTAHLAPANGFPPEAYGPFAAALSEHFRVVGYRPRPLWSDCSHTVLRSWRDLAADMLGDLQGRGDWPMLGVGHSLGGILTLYAALRRPELFRGVALIDPVFLPRHLLPLIWALRKIGQDHRSGLAQGAARRRDLFATVDEARARYAGRGMFANFVPEALEGYLAGGLRADDNGGVRLAWPRSWEARIFALVPTDTWNAARQLRMPLLIVRGNRSDLLTERSWRQLRRMLPNAQFAEINGGHMVPMEQPAAVAEAIVDWAAAFGKSGMELAP